MDTDGETPPFADSVMVAPQAVADETKLAVEDDAERFWQ
jgi:hypothetical protein